MSLAESKMYKIPSLYVGWFLTFPTGTNLEASRKFREHINQRVNRGMVSAVGYL
jgi:hypothetical protein